jgi:5'-nucleotidase
MTKTILIDLDGVLANWGAHWDWHLDHCYEPWETGRIPRHTEQRSFDLKAGLDFEEQRIVDEVMAFDDFYAYIPEIEGAANALAMLTDAGHDVFICTSPWLPNRTCASDKLTWVDWKMGAGWADRTIITKDKTMVHGDILIDDKPDVKGLRKPSWEHILFDQPYNQQVVGKRRIMSWSDFDVEEI